MNIGDRVRYLNPDQEQSRIYNFGSGTIKHLSVNTDHVFVETDNHLLSGWYHDYNLEVVNESQRTY